MSAEINIFSGCCAWNREIDGRERRSCWTCATRDTAKDNNTATKAAQPGITPNRLDLLIPFSELAARTFRKNRQLLSGSQAAIQGFAPSPPLRQDIRHMITH